MSDRSEPGEGLRRWMGPLVAVALFGAGLAVLTRELRGTSYHELSRAVYAIPSPRLALAALLTVANYLVLSGYDLLSFAYAGRSLPRRQILATSMIAYAISNSVGFAMLSGASVRWRFYSRWGVGAADLSRIVLFYSTTFWLGLLTLGGLSLAVSPVAALADVPGHVRVAGLLLLGLVGAYALAASVRREPLRLLGFEVTMPGPRKTAAQFALSTLDWALAAAVLHALLPPRAIPFPSFLGAFLGAQLLGLASHVPGGLGVFESVLVLLVKPALGAAELLPALLAYRVVYYLVPFVLALAALAADEIWQRRHQAAKVRAVFGAVAQEMTPRLLAVLTFLAGALLLFSGATPAAPGRLSFLDRFLPLAVLETSHFLGSCAGVTLLLLSQGIARRLDLSFYLTSGALAVGIAASLLKGADYEEALLLLLLLLAFLPARAKFDRRAAFFATRFSPGWVAAVAAILGASVFLGFFSWKHVEYSHELWWQFELEGEASRFLRATVGVAIALLAFGVRRLMRAVPPEVRPATEDELEAAARALPHEDSTLPFLVFLGDKTLLFDEAREAFLMYGVQRRTWVALGDPVGPSGRAHGLTRAFLARADDYDGVPVFYQVRPERLHVYADFGLAFAKLGEEARVPLAGFGLEGREGKGFRNTLNRLEREGVTFRVVPEGAIPGILGALREVSDDWLRTRGAAEKGFSLGAFDERYLRRFPVAVVEREGRIEAFANLWPGPNGVELSVDLTRFRTSAPKNVMEGLFLHIMLWGKDRGYRFFNLGMAPLSGLETSPVAPLWNRLASFVYERGEAFYNFQGLRAFKEKFHPVWEPRYLAYPGGLALPRILADIAALIAGGYRRIFLK